MTSYRILVNETGENLLYTSYGSTDNPFYISYDPGGIFTYEHPF